MFRKQFSSAVAVWLLLLLSLHATAQQAQPGSGTAALNLPDFVPPTPDASAILKAEQLNVGFTTGTPNVSVPLYDLQAGSYRLPISLNYSSTGVKVDEVASLVGMGWSLNHGGVVSRVVLGEPDEKRNYSLSNFTVIENSSGFFDFAKYAQDKESDIFTFSFAGYSGKFIIGDNGLPIQLTNNNLKIVPIRKSATSTAFSDFTNGFVITTDDGTAYTFKEAETVYNRNPIGDNIGKTYSAGSFKTSWYLSRIELPSAQKSINFAYDSARVKYESSITQTITKVTYSENSCLGSSEPTACRVGEYNFTGSVAMQETMSKYISQVTTSDKDVVSFAYDGRQDLVGGRRLASIRVRNRNGYQVRHIQFGVFYTISTAVAASRGNLYLGNESREAARRRLYLASVSITGAESSAQPLTYSFGYLQPAGLPHRLSMAQDVYGYYNGKTTNHSLLPRLPQGDANYTNFNNGTGLTTGYAYMYGPENFVTFGDRSISPAHATMGLLEKVTYPTGGHDLISWQENRKGADGTLCGGSSVSRITSFSSAGEKASEREFIYRYKDTNVLSAILVSEYLTMSFVQERYSAPCGGGTLGPGGAVGPMCRYGIVSSNINNPVSVLSGQHVYFRSVLEVGRGKDGASNGMVEHRYQLARGGNLNPQPLYGKPVLNTPLQVVPDFIVGETNTNTYKSVGQVLVPVQSIARAFYLDDVAVYTNYVVRADYELGSHEYYNIDKYSLHRYTVRTGSTLETEHFADGSQLTRATRMEYANPSYTYPTAIITTESDGEVSRVDRKYPHDFPGLAFMVGRNIVSPAIEERTYKGEGGAKRLLSTRRQLYDDNWFADKTLIASASVELLLEGDTQGQRILYESYDRQGNVLGAAMEDGSPVSLLWDYGQSSLVARVSGARSADIAFTSFESDGAGNWSGLDRAGFVPDARSITGKKHYSLPAIHVFKAGLSAAREYTVTYWSKGGSLAVSGTQPGWPQTLGSVSRSGQNWTLYAHRVAGVNQVSVTGAGSIDELRLYPVGAQMTTFTHEPLVGMTGQSDVNGRSSYYEYDQLGRLALIRDENSDILKTFCYNYSGQLEQCAFFYNTARSQVFVRNNCGVGYVGSAVTYTVPAGQYSGSTQAEADARAQEDIDNNGQEFAKERGVCQLSCASSSCTGDDKRCINGLCETGVKVYTGSVQEHGGLWRCTYRYEWSDGSWSASYIEYASSRCLNTVDPI